MAPQVNRARSLAAAAALLIAGGIARAQTGSILINCGGPAIGNYQADHGSTGGTASGDTANSTDVWASWRYGASFSYAIPAPIGTYFVGVNAMEVNQTAPGLRVFTVTVNGQTSPPIDLYKLAGLQGHYEIPFIVYNGSGNLQITFQASVRFALCNYIRVGSIPGWGYYFDQTETFTPPAGAAGPAISYTLKFPPAPFSTISVLFASSQPGQSQAWVYPASTQTLSLPLPAYRPLTSQDYFFLAYRSILTPP